MLGHDFARPELLAEALTHPSALATRSKGRRRARRGGGAAAITSGSNSSATGCWGWSSRICCGAGSRPSRKGHLTRRPRSWCGARRWPRVAGRDRARTALIQLSPAEAASGAARNPGDPGRCCRGGDRGDLSRWRVRRRLRLCRAVLGAADRRDGDGAAARSEDDCLQEWAQGRGLAAARLPAGRDERPRPRAAVHVAVRVTGHDEASATARSKRAAETAAAAVLLERLSDKRSREHRIERRRQ